MKNRKKKNIHIEIESKEKFLVKADLNMINTVVRNLLSNAIKFTPERGIIRINSRLEEDMAVVSIEDNGVGIEEEKCNKIFEVYKNKSTLGTKDEKGTGLGLIICKEFVELNRGKIWVESELGRGTVFSFSIPLSK